MVTAAVDEAVEAADWLLGVPAPGFAHPEQRAATRGSIETARETMATG
jgi:hypothetical protein